MDMQPGYDYNNIIEGKYNSNYFINKNQNQHIHQKYLKQNQENDQDSR
jgi:hypothetical protein